MTFCRADLVAAWAGIVAPAIRQAAAKAKLIEVLRIMAITCNVGVRADLVGSGSTRWPQNPCNQAIGRRAGPRLHCRGVIGARQPALECCGTFLSPNCLIAPERFMAPALGPKPCFCSQEERGLMLRNPFYAPPFGSI